MSTVSQICELCCGLIPKNRGESNKRYGAKRFCSQHCANKVLHKDNFPSEANRKAVSLANSGARSHHWKGGISANRREYYNLKSLERYALMKGAKGSFTVQEWTELKAKHNYRCNNCKIEESVAKLTKDHITPITKGGSNYISNIQPLCQSCNSKKHNKIITNG